MRPTVEQLEHAWNTFTEQRRLLAAIDDPTARRQADILRSAADECDRLIRAECQALVIVEQRAHQRFGLRTNDIKQIARRG